MATSLLSWAPAAVSAAEQASWTVVLHPTDLVVGDALGQLHTHRQWITGFDKRSGVFEVALRRKAIAISAPRCRMDYLILTIPVYYPENPKQASVRERRVVYDALVALQAKGKGSATVAVEAPEPLSRLGKRGIELVACNLYFAFPISVQVSAQ
ncbi:hypothetical protein EB232_12455 [Mesorhizobium sp. NZP2077]|nr:hypothetical protein EB232_12455 [Mesorhizobium sp. NZP2077]